MSTSTQRRAHVLEATQRAVERVIDLVLSAADRNVRVPDSPEWTVADTFAHVVTVAPRYAKGPRQQGRWVADPRDLSDLNADEMRELGTSDPAALATALRSTTAALGEQIEGYGETQPVFRFHGGSMISADTALGILLGELLVHGRDMAKALRRPWPIDPRQAAMVIEGVTPILPGWVDHNRARGLTATFEIAPNAGTRHLWSFTDGALTIDPVRGRGRRAHHRRRDGAAPGALPARAPMEGGGDRAALGLGSPSLARLHAHQPLPEAVGGARPLWVRTLQVRVTALTEAGQTARYDGRCRTGRA